MPFRTNFWAVAAACAAVAAFATDALADSWRLGAFQIDWRDGYTRADVSGVIHYFSPADQIGVTVDVLDHAPMSAEEEKAAVEHWRAYARTELIAVAARHGRIAIPVHEEVRKDGAVLIALAEEQAMPESKGFGLFFLLIRPDGRLAQIVVEGPGAAAERMAQFRPYLDTARWTDRPRP